MCVGNCCRSQMAEGLARSLGGERYEIFSAGSRPAGFVAREAVAALQEVGIDISKHHSKGVNQLPQEKYHAIVTMGCGDACPHIPADHRFDWKIPDPIGHPVETFRAVRELIREHVERLLRELDANRPKPPV